MPGTVTTFTAHQRLWAWVPQGSLGERRNKREIQTAWLAGWDSAPQREGRRVLGASRGRHSALSGLIPSSGHPASDLYQLLRVE